MGGLGQGTHEEKPLVVRFGAPDELSVPGLQSDNQDAIIPAKRSIVIAVLIVGEAGGSSFHG